MGYDWELMALLLQRARDSAGGVSFTPRGYAEELARDREERGGQMPGNMDEFRLLAADYESLLFEGSFIESRPPEQGGNGENFILTQRGIRLLDMLEDTTGGGRALLDGKGLNALTPEIFDGLSGTRPAASSGLG